MEPATLLDWLEKKYPQSKRQTLKRMVQSRRVKVNGKVVCKLKDPVKPGDTVEVGDRPVPVREVPAKAAGFLDIIHEDDDILVVCKPPGLLTSTVPRERRPTLLARVREHVARQKGRFVVGLIHRLDRDAAGLLIFSKNDDAFRSLKSQFFHHTVEREYRAILHGVPHPSKGTLETYLLERADGTVYSTRQISKGQKAVTNYEVLKSEGKRTLVKVVLHTGRKHQIRVHMAGLGTPVVGDVMYGPDPKAPRLMLAATRLTVEHPGTGRRMTFAVPVPEEFGVKE